jgi:hypothetical protein
VTFGSAFGRRSSFAREVGSEQRKTVSDFPRIVGAGEYHARIIEDPCGRGFVIAAATQFTRKAPRRRQPNLK